jgi:hypothetical protein
MNMKRSTQDVIMVSFLVIVIGFGCYLWGSYNANGKALLIQDAEKVQKNIRCNFYKHLQLVWKLGNTI